MRILGLMSGTSCDGLDCIDINLDLSESYDLDFKINSFVTVPYSKVDRSFLLSIRGKDSLPDITIESSFFILNVFDT